MTADTGDCAEVVPDLPTRIADGTLTYRVPEVFRGVIRVGVRTLVPLGPRTAYGYVMEVHPCEEGAGHHIREILEVADPEPLFPEPLASLARWVADETLSSLREAVRCLVPSEIARRHVPPRRPRIASYGPGEALQSGNASRPAERGAAAAGAREPSVAPGVAPDERPALVWGDAGVRLSWIIRAAQAAAARGGQVLVVVPKIALTPVLVDEFRLAVGDHVAAYHSGLSPRRRREVWERIRAGDVTVLVGTRGALFAPLDRLRLIVVDEEQDPSFKADASPRYHGRDVALYRGRLEGARVVFGSSTPSLEAYAAALSGDLTSLRLPRQSPAVPATVVDMRAGPPGGRPGILSQLLVEAIRRHLQARGRVALFVNRLGYARVLVCHECGYAVRCARCDVAMPYDRETGSIRCRMCGDAAPAPGVCPRCKGVALRWVGPGIKRVEEVVRRLFPGQRIARVDRETEPSFETVAQSFAEGRIRLVVGTQLLLRARQLRPSLIGVIDADQPLYRPDFRAAERAFQQLHAVIALAGGSPGPEAVVQTRAPDHPALAALQTDKDERFYESELAVRREFGYPPFTHLARLIATAPDRLAAYALAERAAEIARGCGVEVLGPALALGRGGRVRVQCILRASGRSTVQTAAREARRAAVRGRSTRLAVEIDPQELSVW